MPAPSGDMSFLEYLKEVDVLKQIGQAFSTLYNLGEIVTGVIGIFASGIMIAIGTMGEGGGLVLTPVTGPLGGGVALLGVVVVAAGVAVGAGSTALVVDGGLGLLDSLMLMSGGGGDGGRTPAELDALASDPAHGGKIDAKSIAERDVGLGLESQGKVGKLIRDPSGSAEFIDTTTGQKWDVKAFNSKYAPKGYNLTDAMANINKSLANGENVMLDTRSLNAADLQQLTNEIVRQGLSNKILQWP